MRRLKMKGKMLVTVCFVVVLVVSPIFGLSTDDFQVVEITESGKVVKLKQKGVVDLRSRIEVRFSEKVKTSGEEKVLVRAFVIPKGSNTPVEIVVPRYTWRDTTGKFVYIVRRAEIIDAEIPLEGLSEFDRIKIVVYNPEEGEPLPSQTFTYTLRRLGWSFGSITRGPSPHVATIPVVSLRKGETPSYFPALAFTFYRVSRHPIVEHCGLAFDMYLPGESAVGLGISFAITSAEGDILQIGVGRDFYFGDKKPENADELRYLVGTTITAPLDLVLSALKVK